MRAKFFMAPVGVLVLLSGLVGAVAPAQALGVATVSAPGVPTHVVTSGATPRTIDLVWAAPISDGGAAITDYSVAYRKVGESTWSSFQDGVSPTTSATISGLSGSSLYEFRVSAWNSLQSGWSVRASVVAAGDFSSCVVMSSGSAQCWGDNTNLQLGHNVAAYGDAPAPVSASALAAGPPRAPKSITARATKRPGRIAVTWTPAVLNGAPSAIYVVSYKASGRWITAGETSRRSYTITGLKKGTYSVKVTAKTVEGVALVTKNGIVLTK